MKQLKLISIFSLLLFSTLAISSCNPSSCNCTANWNNSDTYFPGDQRSHLGTCYNAVNQNSGVEPGPWMVNGNDSWQECQP